MAKFEFSRPAHENFQVGDRIRVVRTLGRFIKLGEQGVVKMRLTPRIPRFGADLLILFDGDQEPICLNENMWAGSLEKIPR